MTSTLFNNIEVNLLFALRSRYIDCKANFKNGNNNTVCQLCSDSEDNQPHILQCKVINRFFKSKDIVNESIDYSDIFKDVRKQKVIVTIYTKLLEIRKQLLNQVNSNNPSILDKMLKNSYNLQKCIVNFSSGN